MVKWTESQSDAIESRGQNLLISAAAGSGKTAVLVERIIQLLIKDKININTFLIVTFTKAAAGEMRERISKALFKAIEEGAGDEKHLRRQIQLLDSASISTLHSFCIDVVKRHFHLIEIDPIFRIGDEIETSLLKLESLEEVFEEEYEKATEAFLDLVEMYGGNRNDQGLQDLVLNLYNFIQSKPDPRTWLEEKIEDFNISKREFSKTSWGQTLREQLEIELIGALEYFNHALEVALLPGGPGVYEPILEDDIKMTEELLESLQLGLESFYEKLLTLKHKRLVAAKEADEDLKDRCKDLRENGKKTIKEISEKLLVKSPEEFSQDLNKLHPYMAYLSRLVFLFENRYGDKKREKSILDFNDLEHYALNILNHGEVAEEYRKKYNYIFVDEYQDSNLLQETIVNAIKGRDNVFLVGDVKQSIYRFRLADPSIFIDKYENYGVGEGLNKRIDLSKNFRSRGEIIEGVNYIFQNIMSKKLGEVEYDHRASLYLGGSFQEIMDPEIELHIIEREKSTEEEEMEDLDSISNIELEGFWVANRIKELLDKEIFDPKIGAYRKIQYKDIVILLRTTKNWAQSFLEIFISQGIPSYADVNVGYFEAIEVNIFMNLLKLIDNKRQDVPLLSVLRSPIFNFTPEELIEIRGESQGRTYFETIEEYIEKKDNALKDKLQRSLNKLSKWKEQARYIPIEDFLWKVLMDTKYYYYVGAMPGGIQRQANIKVLLERARQFQETSLKGLFHFIKFVDQLKSSSGDMGTAKTLGENDNVVRIMSVHKSKGLEFPVVILAGLGKEFNLRDSRQSVLFHKDLGLGPNYVDLEKRTYNESIAKIAMKNKIKFENLSEEMRVLYVALTRPKDKLIMVGSVKNILKRIGKWSQSTGVFHLSKGKTYLDWIAPQIIKHKDGKVLRDLGEVDVKEEAYKSHDSKWEVGYHYPGDILRTEAIKQKEQKGLKNFLLNFDQEGEEDTSLRDEIVKPLQWEYKNKAATLLPSKLSVTDIKREGQDSPQSLGIHIPMMTQRPAFMESTGQLTGPEKGTAMHFVLQHLDLNSVENREDIEGQIEDMIIKELIRERDGKSVDVEKLLQFFHSPLGKRMLQANKIYREVPFNLVKGACQALPQITEVESCKEEILIQGIIDCYFEEEDGFILIDYKTDYYESDRMKNELVKKYKSQIDLYGEALEKILHRSVKEKYLYLFHGNEGVQL